MVQLLMFLGLTWVGLRNYLEVGLDVDGQRRRLTQKHDAVFVFLARSVDVGI